MKMTRVIKENGEQQNPRTDFPEEFYKILKAKQQESFLEGYRYAIQVLEDGIANREKE